MKVYYSHAEQDVTENVPSIFLAGPTARDGDGKSLTAWRIKALEILEKMGFAGHVYVPEFLRANKSEQIDWEVYHLEKAKCILFWVPRDLEKLPAFTTNIEFGEWMRSGKIVFGAPVDAEKVSYMIYRAQKYGVPVSDDLEQTLASAVKMAQA